MNKNPQAPRKGARDVGARSFSYVEILRAFGFTESKNRTSTMCETNVGCRWRQVRPLLGCKENARADVAKATRLQVDGSVNRLKPILLGGVTPCGSWGLLGDDDVVDVAFAEAGGGDADEFAELREFGERACADVAHAAFEAADELIGEAVERAFVGDAPFDAFGNGLAAFGAFLGIAIGGAGFHGAGGTHAAVGLEGAALIENCFAGSFFGAGEEAADHDAGSAGGDGFGDVAGIFDAAVGDDGDAGAFGGFGGFDDGGDLGNAGAGDDARGADGAGADADFEAVDAEGDEIFRAVVGGDVAGDELHFGEAMANGFDGFHDAFGVAVGGVNGEDVGFGFGHFDGAFEEIAGGANGGADAEAAVVVFGGAGIFEFFLDVFDGDEALEVEVLIDDEKFFDAMFLEDFFGFVEGGADGDGDEIVLGHDVADELGVIFLEAEVAVGEDAGEAGAAGDGKAGDAVLVHDFEGLAEGDVGGDGDGVDDHAGFGTLDTVDFFDLAVDGHVAVDDADAALAGDADGEAGFGDGVHGGGGEGNVEGEFAGELRGGVHFGGQDGGFAGEEEDVVECQTFGNGTFNHGSLFE